MPSRALLQAATEADRCSLKQLGGQALRVQQTWEVAAREIVTRKNDQGKLSLKKMPLGKYQIFSKLNIGTKKMLLLEIQHFS